MIIEPATGPISARIHGAESILRARAVRARAAAARLDDLDSPFAASLRGKAKGYDEAADLIRALDRGSRLPAKSRETMKEENV